MTRLIDADAVYKEICRIYEYEYPTASGAFDEFVSKTLENIIYNAPTVDAEPVRHGKWQPMNERNEIYGDVYMCDNCGRGFVSCENFHYCPKCGAKMDGE